MSTAGRLLVLLCTKSCRVLQSEPIHQKDCACSSKIISTNRDSCKNKEWLGDEKHALIPALAKKLRWVWAKLLDKYWQSLHKCVLLIWQTISFNQFSWATFKWSFLNCNFQFNHAKIISGRTISPNLNFHYFHSMGLKEITSQFSQNIIPPKIAQLETKINFKWV